ncbi:MAG: class I SAM-dependent methyltransferase [Ignavibacteriales bacterium]|nr:class I SAM-dependent methyltransferase [Ignavibacteriales bacterium]
MSVEPILCPVCSSINLKLKPFGYQFNGRWLGGIECKDCRIIFIHPQPSKEEIQSLYPKDYFEKDYRCGHEGSYFDDESLTRLGDDNLFRDIKRCRSTGMFLEIGCAGGALLNAARTAGFDVVGIEFSEAAAQFARKKFNLHVEVGDVTTVELPAGTFDVIFMGDVLEHLPGPNEALKRINRLLKMGGTLVIRCPMQTNTLFSRLGFFVYGMVGKKATVQLPPYHLFEYRTKSIVNLLERHGFKVDSSEESIMSPFEISLRGSMIQKIFKKLFHYPNYIITKTMKMLGDRIEVFAIKELELER